jgi:hypothetical protein
VGETASGANPQFCDLPPLGFAEEPYCLTGEDVLRVGIAIFGRSRESFAQSRCPAIQIDGLDI